MTEPSPLDLTLSEIAAAGFLVNNLFQLTRPDGTVVWRASLCLEKTFEFGEGINPASALQAAVSKVLPRDSTGLSCKTFSKKLTLEELFP